MGFEQRPGSPDREPESSDNQEFPGAREHVQSILDEHGELSTQSNTVREARLEGQFPNIIGTKWPAYLDVTEKMLLNAQNVPIEVYEVSLLMGMHRTEWHVDPEGDVWARETLLDRMLPPSHWERAEEQQTIHLAQILATEQKKPIRIATPEAHRPAEPAEDKPTSAIRRILDLMARGSKPDPIKLPVRRPDAENEE